MSFNTKLFFDEEHTQPFFEGSEVEKGKKRKSSLDGSKRGHGKSKKNQLKEKHEPIPDEDQEGFIRKTFGLFSVAIALQLTWVIIVSQQTDDSSLRKMAKNFVGLFAAIVVVIIATTLVVLKKGAGNPVPNGMGYACWAMQACGLTYVVGFMAARKKAESAEIVLVAEIATIIIALLCTFFGGKLLKLSGADKKMKALGSTFLILSIVLATVLIASSAFGIAGMSNKIILCVVLMLAVAFLIADTQFIINGRYGKIDKDDYIFASMKLFVDFILVFGIIMQLFE